MHASARSAFVDENVCWNMYQRWRMIGCARDHATKNVRVDDRAGRAHGVGKTKSRRKDGHLLSTRWGQ